MENNEHKPDFLFEKVNYKILLIGIAVIGYWIYTNVWWRKR
jgi:hypothetical protein